MYVVPKIMDNTQHTTVDLHRVQHHCTPRDIHMYWIYIHQFTFLTSLVTTHTHWWTRARYEANISSRDLICWNLLARYLPTGWELWRKIATWYYMVMKSYSLGGGGVISDVSSGKITILLAWQYKLRSRWDQNYHFCMATVCWGCLWHIIAERIA